MNENNIVNVTIKNPKFDVEYAASVIISFNWEEAKKQITQEWLEENKTFLFHFETRPPSEINEIEVYDAVDHYPDTFRVGLYSNYIGNVEGVGDSEERDVEIAKIWLNHMFEMSAAHSWQHELYSDSEGSSKTFYKIVKVIR